MSFPYCQRIFFSFKFETNLLKLVTKEQANPKVRQIDRELEVIVAQFQFKWTALGHPSVQVIARHLNVFPATAGKAISSKLTAHAQVVQAGRPSQTARSLTTSCIRPETSREFASVAFVLPQAAKFFLSLPSLQFCPTLWTIKYAAKCTRERIPHRKRSSTNCTFIPWTMWAFSLPTSRWAKGEVN